MYAECADCKTPLTRGFFISVRGFEKLKRGEKAEIKETVCCPTCGKIAIRWDYKVTFYKEEKNGY
jgi:RNase P subunit RPR2